MSRFGAAPGRGAAAGLVTVRELEQTVGQLRGASDRKLAQRLSEMRLTERLSQEKYLLLAEKAPGRRSREALLAISDVSQFLDLPPHQGAAEDVPGAAEQRRMVALTMSYANKTLRGLPDFLATRVTASYDDRPGFLRIARPEHALTDHLPLYLEDTTRIGVVYRDGGERNQSKSGQEIESKPVGMESRGEFGPILRLVLIDAARVGMLWGGWEQASPGKLAVFRFAVADGDSHYLVYQKRWGYHAEIAVDPADGSIRRLAIRADTKPTDAIVEADILVEYGSVEIGGAGYICPVKSIAFSTVVEGSEYVSGKQVRTRLNDVAFEEYRKLGSETRMLVDGP